MRGRLLGVAMATLAVACSQDAPPPGNASLLVRMLAPADVTRVTLEVQPANIVRDLSADEYDEATGAFAAILTVPVGTHTISVSAYAGTTLIGTASATVPVTAGATATVHLTIVDSRPVTPGPDRAPIITSFVVPVATLTVGASTPVSAAATDLDGDRIAFAWTAMPAGCGTFGDSNAAATSFVAGAVGTCTVTVTASANGKDDTDGIALDITPAPGQLSVDGTVVTRPEVSSMQVDTTVGTCAVDRASTEGVCQTAAVSGTTCTVSVTWRNWRAGAYSVAATLVDSCGGSTTAASLEEGGATTTQVFSWTPSTPAGTRSACAVTATLTVTGLPDGATLADAMSIGLEVVPPPPP